MNPNFALGNINKSSPRKRESVTIAIAMDPSFRGDDKYGYSVEQKDAVSNATQLEIIIVIA